MSTEPQAYSIAQFCTAHNISRAGFYNLLNQGRAPAVMKVGKRTLISVESAREWRARLTSESHERVAA
jgi:predicted DNA-binding transcriptional regulator AlpA